MPGNGGMAGGAGLGGLARVVYGALTFDLGGGAFSQNAVTLTASVLGGRGGNGGSSGHGSNSSGSLLSTVTTSTATSSFRATAVTTSTAGGLANDGADGATGRIGSVTYNDIAVSGQNVRISLNGTATGGAGGDGGNGGNGGRGVTGANGGQGGQGGDGGKGSVLLNALNVNVTGGLNLEVNLHAIGSTGGAGGSGGIAGSGSDRVIESLNGVGGSTTTTVHALAGNGGDGGNGGQALARMLNSTVTASEAADSVDITLRASGGLGVPGGFGGSGVADSNSSSGTDFVTAFVVFGTPLGQKGATGVNGTSQVIMTGNTIALGGGDDAFVLRLMADGQGKRFVTMATSSFDGGVGSDRITIGSGSVADRAVVFDVALNQVRLVGGDANVMTGFETFVGGSAADRFLDGAGDQRYQGNAGADRFEFRGGQAGADRIDGFAAVDLIRLRGFGTGLDSFDDVLSAATDTGSGVVIQTSATSAILIASVLKAALMADDFLF